MKAKEISPGIVKQLEMISMNDLKPGVSHALDRNRAIETFNTLKSRQMLPDPYDIEIWALDSGWSKEEAYNLKGIAQAILEGKRLRKSG